MKPLVSRFELLFIAFRCLMKSIWQPNQLETNSSEVVVVVNLTSNLGDMVCSTTLVNGIKIQKPDCKIVVIGSPRNETLFKNHPHVAKYIASRSFNGALKQLQELKPSMGVCANQNVLEAGLLYLSGTQRITSFYIPQKAGIAFQLIKHLVSLVEYTPGRYIPNEFLKLLVPLGMSDNPVEMSLVVDSSEKEKITKDLAHSQLNGRTAFAVVAPTAGQAFKELPVERLAKILQYIWDEYGIASALTGGPKDAEVGERIVAELKEVPVYNGIGQSVEEMNTMISLSSLLISYDSASAQIARAFNIPTFVIVGITDPVEHHTRDEKNWYVAPENPHVKIQSYVSDIEGVDLDKAAADMHSLTLEKITAEFDSFLPSLGFRKKLHT